MIDPTNAPRNINKTLPLITGRSKNGAYCLRMNRVTVLIFPPTDGPSNSAILGGTLTQGKQSIRLACKQDVR